MAPRLFGTDGIRGTAGQPPLDPPTVRRIGAALVKALDASEGHPHLLIGRDTRESGEWIERELAAGARRAGADVRTLGVLPTPAIAYLTRTTDVTLGAVISASHNPYEDNGIKVFSGAGHKFNEDREQLVEAIVADASWQLDADEAPPVTAVDESEPYLDHLHDMLADSDKLRGRRLVVDCANGATTPVAARLFRSLGFDVTLLGASPDGRNINLGCGSTHPESMAAIVPEVEAIAGVAFDGDGDRAIFADEWGRLVDGDAVMLMCARQLKAEGRLRGDTVVATVMSNIGLEIALAESGIALRRTQVGDKYVMEELLRDGFSLGGEQSGHIIFLRHATTGDGLLTAVQFLSLSRQRGVPVSEIAGCMERFPQLTLNIPVIDREKLDQAQEVWEAVAAAERDLADGGRVLVRASGTEPVVRVMVEAPSQEEASRHAEAIAETVRSTLGSS
jgi:phosphoglucosamine mutase